jgi:uncharacterized phage-like protein YoqJ
MSASSCSFTGHHPMRFPFGYDEEDDLCQRIRNAMLLQIFALYENGITDFYSDYGVGASLWGAELVLLLMERYPQIRLFCILLYEEQSKKWTPELREQYYTILKKSTSNHLIITHYTRDRPIRCNRFLIDHASFMIAVYDNAEVAELEPVTHLVSYARKNGRGIITIDPDTAFVTPITIKKE